MLKIFMMLSFLLLTGNTLPSEEVSFADVTTLINQERSSRQIPSLLVDPVYTCAAEKQATYLGKNKLCSHTGEGGSNVLMRLKSCNAAPITWGEIVACGPKRSEAAVKAWLNSPPHRNIMLDSRYTKFGCFVYNNRWVCVFGK